MSKMGTSLQKGKKWRRLLAVSLIMALIVAIGCGMSASALGWDGTFKVQVLGQSTSIVDGLLRVSTTEEVNLQAKKVFRAYSFSSVKAIEIYTDDIYIGSPVEMKVNITSKEKQYWTSDIGMSSSSWKYRAKSSINTGAFNEIMAKFTMKFKEEAGVQSDKVTLHVRAYTDKDKMIPDKQIPAGDKYGSSKLNEEYTCDIEFYAFAQGRLDKDSAVLDYKTERTENYDDLYEDFAPTDTDNSLLVSPEDAEQGRITMDMYISDVGGGSTATFGYQIKEANQPWVSTAAKYQQGQDLLLPIYEEDGMTIKWIETGIWDDYGSRYRRAFAPNYGNGIEWERKRGYADATDSEGNYILDENDEHIYIDASYYFVGKPIPGTIDLTKWDTSTPLHLTIDGVDSGSAKTVRGWVCTDGGANNYKFTEDLTVQYQKPSINSFTSVQENAMYKSGGRVNLAYLVGFSDTNKVGQTYTGVDGKTYTGPALRVDFYFTDSLNQTTGSNGETVDNTKWYRLPEQYSQVGLLESADGVSTNFEPNQNIVYSLPASMQEWTGNTTPIDSTNCAFKMVVTDLNTGYSVDSYSKKFTIDSSAPTNLQINARKDLTEQGRLTLINEGGDVTKVPEKVETVGGKGAQVKVYIGNASDAVKDGDTIISEGSGIKEYRYRMFYLASKDVPSSCKTTKEVMEFLNTATAENVGKGDYVNVEFTNWTPAEDAYWTKTNDDGTTEQVKLDNRGQVVVAKDGYYRVDAKAIDNAGHETGEPGAAPIPHGFFQVDLTAPSTPQVRVVTIDNNNLSSVEGLPEGYTVNPADFTPYDNRTYSDKTVWLFAYSKPITGKSIQEFMYSTDGGLNWKKFSEATLAAGKTGPVKLIDMDNATRTDEDGNAAPYTVRAYTDERCNQQEDFPYQAGVNLTGVGLFDYKSILVKAIDKLGNESLASDPAVIRVSVGTIHTTATMSHEPIEVALSIGDTDMESSYVTPSLKNAAAKKINDKFFGVVDTSSDAKMNAQRDPKNAEFNPLALLYTKSGSTWVRHECSWEAVGSLGDAAKSDISCSGPCHYDDCPYKTYGDKYSYYLPEYVNVSGLSSSSASANLSGWRVYDLNDLNNDKTTPNNNTKLQKGQPYIFGPNDKGMIFNLGIGSGINVEEQYPGENNKQCKKRGRHIVDITHAVNDGTTWTKPNEALPSGKAWLDPNHGDGRDQNGNWKGDLSTLLFLGHGDNAFQHFLFLPNDNPTKKTIQFSLNMNVIDNHTWWHSGFFFNSTIRETSQGSGSWVLSGYRIVASNYPGNAARTYVRIQKVVDMAINDNNLKNGGSLTSGTFPGGGTATDLPSGSVTYPATWKNADGTDMTGDDLKVTNFQIICDGTKTKVKYTKGPGNCTERAFAQIGKWLFTDSSNTKENGARVFDCPRPTVGNVQIGTGKWDGDRDCYGFGPYTGHKSHGCSSETSVIFADMAMTMTVSRSLSEVVTEPQWGNGKAKFIANIDDNAVDDFNDPVLSSQIQWRLNNDKARYIGWGVDANKPDTIKFLERISGAKDDPNTTDDDKTYATQLARTGMYESNTLTNGNEKDKTIQIEEVATYITSQYYDEFGFDGSEGGTTVQDQLQSSTNAKGTNYELGNIESLDLSVTPEEYNTSTANADYPAGRWWMTHDITGYDTDEDPRADKSSDALETGITRPGRYSYYFAPEMTAAKAGRLDPETAVFDFVVSNKPASLFAASVKRDLITPSPAPAATASPDPANPTEAPAATPTPEPTYGPMYIELEDMSYDPDCVSGPVWYDNDNQKEHPLNELAFENGINTTDITKVQAKDEDGNPIAGKFLYNGTLPKEDEKKVRQLATTNGYVMLNGVSKVEWRWELLSKTARTNEDGTPVLDDKKNQLYDLTVVKSIPWTINSFSGTTLEDLVGAENMDNGALEENNVLTVYQRVTDSAAKRVAVKDAAGAVTGYKYLPTNGLVSSISQANVTTENGATYTITYPPLSSLSLDKTELFDTAENAAKNNTVTVTRGSSQPQGQDFAVSWAVDLGSEYAPSDTVSYIPLEPDADGNYIIKSLKRKDSTGTRVEVATDVLVLKKVVAPTITGNLGDNGYTYTDIFEEEVTVNGDTVTSTGGRWTIPYEFIQQYVPVGKNMVLQITEKSFGYAAEDVAKWNASDKTDDKLKPTKKYIQDQSARAIQYKTDSTPPTAQVVTTSQTGGTSTDGSYQASSYLDVSDGKSNVTIKVGGSVDNQGELGGYGYYFYDTKPNTTVNAADHERAWYYMDKNKELQNASSVTYGVISDTRTGQIYLADKSADTTTDKSNPASWTWTDVAGNPVNVTTRTDTVPQKTLTLPAILQPGQTQVTTSNGNVLTLDDSTGKWMDTYGNVWSITGATAALDYSNGMYTIGGVHLVKQNGHWVNANNTAEEWSVLNGVATTSTITNPGRTVTLSVAPSATATTATTDDGMVFTKDASGKWHDKAGNEWAITANGTNKTATLAGYSTCMNGIVMSAKEAVAAQNAVNPIGPEGGSIVIDKNVMNEEREPAYSVNVGIFAYDNATGKDTLTGANQTTMTRVENIKLSTSMPMPPEIEVTNDSTQKVAHIGNDGGFRNDARDDKDDVQTSDTSNIANSGVTVTFHPRKATFSYDNETGAYVPDPNGTQTFTEDVFSKADLTGITNVKYTVQYRQSSTGTYEVYMDGATPLQNVVTASSVQRQFDQEGEYEITAQILNGAGTESTERKVHFIIDKTPPTKMTMRLLKNDKTNYQEFTWAKAVTLELSGSSDPNEGANSKYMVSIDDGKTWDDLYLDANGHRIYKGDPDFDSKLVTTVPMSGALSSTLTVPITVGGSHTLRVKARDEVGNEQEVYVLNGSGKEESRAISVKVDGEAPTTPPAKLEPQATTMPMYDSYLVKLDYQGSNGKVVAQLEDESTNDLDRQISVPTGESVKLFFFPAEGKKLGEIKVNGGTVYNGTAEALNQLEYDADMTCGDQKGAYYIKLKNVTTDSTVSVRFPSAVEEVPEVVSEAKVMSDMTFSIMPMMRAATYAAQRTTSEETEPAGAEPTAEPAAVPTASPAPEAAVMAETGSGEEAPAAETGETPAEPDPVQTYNVVVAVLNNGTSEQEGINKVAAGTTFTATITPDDGYTISVFKVNGEDCTPVQNGRKFTYTIDSVEKDIQIWVECVALPKRTLKLFSNDLGKLTLTAIGDATEVDANGNYAVPEGSTVTFLATPNDSTKYVLSSLKVNGEELVKDGSITGDNIKLTYDVKAGEGDLEAYAVFEVGESVTSATFSVTAGEHGRITPSGEDVKIPTGSARTFTVETDYGYTIESITATVNGRDGAETVDYTDKVVSDSDRKSSFIVSVPESGYGEGNSIVVTFKQKTFKVTIETGNYTLHDENGYPYDFKTVTDSLGTRQVAEVPESVKTLTITPVVKDGYKVKNMSISYAVGGQLVNLGAVTEYTLESGIHSDLKLNCSTEQRLVERMRSIHSIVARAEGVVDVNDVLADKPYHFYISDGVNRSAWTAWSNSNTYTFTGLTPEGSTETLPLDPNKEYTIYVQTKDLVGNLSPEVPSTIHTLANMPTALGAKSLNLAGEIQTKSIAIAIDTNNNPAGTKYMAYVAKNSDMSDMQPKEFTSLDSSGNLVVSGMEPGTKYWLQVVAQNEDGVSTQLNNNNIIDIILSPASPEAYTLCFDEPQYPGAPVRLTWDVPDGDVQEIELYRDGYLMKTVPANTKEYLDTEDLPGDHIVVYSYAYVNSSGAGSSQTAVHREYYDPKKIDRAATKKENEENENKGEEATPSPNPEAPTDQPAAVAETGSATPTPAPTATPFPYTDQQVSDARAKVASMNTVKKDNAKGYDIYSETMLYPVYPLNLNMNPEAKKVMAGANGDTYSGNITLYMTYDVREMERYQKYFLTLKAYEYNETTGTVGAEVTDHTKWDHNGDYHDPNTGRQIPQETKAANANGARAEWTGLNTQYVYKVFVNEIQSVGRRTGSASGDNYGGQSVPGVEYTLGKLYYVTTDGFGYRYTQADVANAAGLTDQFFTWGTNGSSKETFAGGNWDRPIHDGYIKFNMSPYVELAQNPYEGNDAEKCPTGKYIVLDQSMKDEEGNLDMTFKLNLKAWDKDGGTNYEVSAKLGGTQVLGSTGVKDGALNATEDLAKTNPYTVTLDARKLPTNVYNNVTLYATDGSTTTEETYKGITVVVNRTMPTVSSGKTSVRKIETNATYAKDTIKITSGLTNNASREQLNQVRLVVMADEYTKKLGASNVTDLRTILCTQKRQPYYDNALALLTEDEKKDTTYISAGSLTEEGLQTVISRLSPPVTAYFKITEDKYNAYLADNAHKTHLRKEVTPTGSEYYWIEQEYALNNNLCEWLVNADNGKSVKVTGEPGEYYVELVANFGGNETAQTVTVDVMKNPSATVLTDAKFGWTDTTLVPQFDYFLAKKHVREQINTYYEKNCITEEEKNTLLAANPVESPAARLLNEAGEVIAIPTDENGDQITAWSELPQDVVDQVAKMQVFTMSDELANISDTWIGGSIEVELGVNNKFDELGVYLATDPTFDPHDGNLTNVKFAPAEHKTGHSEAYDQNGRYSFNASGLEEGVTYYVWSYFRIKDGEEVVREGYSRSYTALTTTEGFDLSRYGFDQLSYEIKEKDQKSQTTELALEAKRYGSVKTSAVLGFKLDYLQADEFGKLITDTEGNPVKVDSAHLDAAKKTVSLVGADSSGVVEFTTSNGSHAPVRLNISDTTDTQGHMIVRLSVYVKDQITGATTLLNGADHTDIFVQDDESPVQTFIIGIYQGEDPNNPLLEEVMDTVDKTKLDHYLHKFEGLQVGYYNNTDELQVIYKNGGTGKLENITAAIYADKAGKNLSEDFVIVQQPTQTALSASGELKDLTGKVTVATADGKGDGVYEGWLFLWADHIDKANAVKIHLYQVVGQSTLSGRIYVTPGMPAETDRTGISKVSLYSDTTIGRYNGTFTQNPLYTTYTDEYGKYTIPNILNEGSRNSDGKESSGKYYIVVERDGFVTYNSPYYIHQGKAADGTKKSDTSLETGATSKTFTFDLRLLGGDVDKSQKVDEKDLSALIDCYNMFVHIGEMAPLSEDAGQVKLCDFNGDGVVNVLDRAFLIGNLSSNGESYKQNYKKLTANE